MKAKNQAQQDIIKFLEFEDETAIIYPFAVSLDCVTQGMLDGIEAGCDGRTDDAGAMHDACEAVLGVNPEIALLRDIGVRG